jgi:hypothetical protein
MQERKVTITVTAIACILVGAFGAIVGYRIGGFHVWPSGETVNSCFWAGSGIGVVGAIITALLLLAAAKEKLWHVVIVGCILTFVGAGVYGAKQANDLHEWGRGMFQKDR